MSFNNGPTIVTNGLVLALDAGDRNSYPGSGTTWGDLAGSNNGSLINGPTFNSDNGGSIVFDGVDDYVIIPYNTSIDFAGDKNITVFQFIKVNSFNDNMTSLIWEDIKDGNGYEPVAIRYGWINSSTKYANFALAWDSNTETVVNSTTVIQQNQIYNVVGTYDGTSMKIYINGILENSNSETRTIRTPLSSDARWIIGAGELTATSYRQFNGNISTTQIYNRALTATEVLQNYNAQKGRFGL